MTRVQKILLGLLVVQVGILLVVRFSGDGATGATETPLVADLAISDATRVELDRGDDRVTLVRGEAGWSVDELDGFPADAGKLEALVEKLDGLAVRRPTATRARYHEPFGVTEDDSEARIRVFTTDGDEPTWDLLFGGSPGLNAIHVRRADEDAVYEVRGVAAYELSGPAANWIDKAWVDVASSDVEEIVVANANGRFAATRGEDGWTVREPEERAGLPVADAEIEDLVDAVVSLRLTGAAGRRDEAEHGFQEVGVRVELGVAGDDGSERISVSIGRVVPDESSKRFVGRDGSDFTGIVWESSVKALLDADLREMMGESSD